MNTGNRSADRDAKVLALWNERAALGDMAGTNDMLAKQIEMRAIASHIRPGQKVLDVGCGNGLATFDLAETLAVEIHGVDFSPEMIHQAKMEQERRGLGSAPIRFDVWDIKEIAKLTERYDVVITERVLINLASWEEQKNAIRDLVGLLNSGGRYLMCENFIDGLENLNTMRVKLGLSAIQVPWHNRYLRRSEAGTVDFARKVAEEDFSSAYYFLSRVVNAWMAKQEGVEPRYDAPVNRLALELCDMPGFSALDIGQTRLWIWSGL